MFYQSDYIPPKSEWVDPEFEETKSLFIVVYDDGDKYSHNCGKDVTVNLASARKIGREWRQYTIFKGVIKNGVVTKGDAIEHLGLDNETDPRFNLRIGAWDIEEVLEAEAED